MWLEKKRDRMLQSLPNEMCNYFIRVKDRARAMISLVKEK